MPSNKPRQSIEIPKSILITAKILEMTSPKLAAKFAFKLFTTPTKFKLPKREEQMEKNSIQEKINIPSLKKNVTVYKYGSSEKKVLLIHGWSGRGTQLYSIADKLIKCGYATISFDAPAHGKSEGKSSDMTEFIATILELEKKFGPFQYAIGHSLGAMSLLNAAKKGLKIKKAVVIGSGDVIKDIMDDFTSKLGMNIATGKILIRLFQKKFNETVNSYSAYIAAKHVDIPVLVIHDEDDADVPVSAAKHITANLKNAELMITKCLGHRKILGDSKVIKKIIQFIES